MWGNPSGNASWPPPVSETSEMEAKWQNGATKKLSGRTLWHLFQLWAIDAVTVLPVGNL
jgi:hypothetical protein